MKVQKVIGEKIKGAKPGFFNKVVWALFGNERDGYIGDTTWNPEQKDNAWIRVKWWVRNPLHNFMWYVVGFADKDSTRYDVNDSDQPGWNKAWSIVEGGSFKYPFYLYQGKKVVFYIGWRSRGHFGIKLNLKLKG